MVDTINQVFALFRLNYHNQYLKAFSSTEELTQVKRLWLDMLSHIEPSIILAATKAVIQGSEYLPTVHTMIKQCEKISMGDLPDAHSAYIEACRAPSPKAAYPWSHPAVYYAGSRCDWYFLQSSAESVAYPIFKEKYQELCRELLQGQPLPALPKASKQEASAPALDKASNLEKLQSLRDRLNL